MRMRRQFQPSVDGLPYRIAPFEPGRRTGCIACGKPDRAADLADLADVAHHVAVRYRYAGDWTSARILAGPPPSGGDGTLLS